MADNPKSAAGGGRAPLDLAERLKLLREKFDALLITEVRQFGGIPDYQGPVGRCQCELRDAIALVLETEAAVTAQRAAPQPLDALRQTVVDFIADTKVQRPGDSRERAEVHTIYRTLNVVLAEIDKLRAASPEQERSHE